MKTFPRWKAPHIASHYFKRIKSSVFKLPFLFIFYFVVSCANGQTTDGGNQSLVLSLSDRIDLITLSGSNPTFSFAATTDYANGINALNASSFQVRSNRAWNLSVKANAATFTGPTGNSMPSSILQVRKNGAGSYLSLSTTDQNIVTSGAQGANNIVNVDYNASPGFSYDGGTYSLVVIFTATQQ